MSSRNTARRTRWWRDLPLIGLWVAFAVALGTMIIVSSIRELSQLEAVLFQVVTLVTGLLASYRFGQNAARDAAYDVIRPHARSALRRILSLRDSLFRLSERIEEYKVGGGNDDRLNVIQAIIEEQIPNGRAAVEDWLDVAPDDVEEILQSWPESPWGGQNGHTN